ncbi:MAG: hypothetical protein NZ872_00990, partial [Archaeoglobaceae archaeon]|nr:hypothetical protein [Archaeoglobaceae archaeon]MDW8127773.1 hypothetical protein [Archaeoglobaceae archaeon]
MATMFRIKRGSLKTTKEQRGIFEVIRKSARGEWLDEEASKILSKRLMQEFEPPEGWYKVEEYPIYSRFIFASAHILYNDEENEYAYMVNEPRLEKDEELLVRDLVRKLEYYVIKPDEIWDKFS